MSFRTRTVFRQLKQAAYERTEMVAFVNGRVRKDAKLKPPVVDATRKAA